MKIFFKVLGALSLFLFSFLLLVLVFLPTILSTSFGKSFILNRLNRDIAGNVSIEKLHLSWLGHQDISNIILTDNEGATVFSAERINGDFSPFTFLFDNSLRTLTLQNVNIMLTTDREGKTNFEQIIDNNFWQASDENEPIFLKHVDLELSNVANELFLKQPVKQTKQVCKVPLQLICNMGI